MKTTEPMDIDTAVEGLIASAQSEDLEEQPDEATDDQTDEAPDTEEVEPDVAEDDADDTDADGDEDGEEDDTDEDDASPQELSDDTPITVMVDGEERTATLAELKRDFSGQGYIQKGMAQNAEERKKLETLNAQFTREREAVAQFVQQLQQTGFIQQPQAPDPALIQSEPIEYMEKWAEYDQQLREYNQQQAQLKAIQTQQTQAQQQALAAFVAEQHQILEREIPEYADPKTRDAFSKSMRETGMHYGFSETEIAQVTDARHVKILHDAMKYRALQKTKDSVAAKAKKAPKVVKPRAQGKPVNNRSKQLQARFQKTGSLDDAVNLLMEQED